MQAKDIPDELLLAVVRAKAPQWANVSDMCAAVPAAPRKVVLAKLHSMIQRNVIHGCACGCRGDFRLHA